MTKQDMKDWIDNAGYEELLSKWRFEPVGSPWCHGEVGKHLARVLREQRKKVGDAVHAATSKRIGW